MTTSKTYNFTSEIKKAKINIKNKLGYEFKNDLLLLHAITHSSLKNDCLPLIDYDNEKLEFIGDSVLDLIVSNFLLFEKDYSLDEGCLTKNRAKLVKEQSLASLARKISLNEFLLFSKAARKINIEDKDSILADAFEALVGGIFLDSSYDTVEKIIIKNFKDDFLQVLKYKTNDYKSLLNEFIGKNQLEMPQYQLVESYGPDHSRFFISSIKISEEVLAKGKGTTIKDSQQEAARLALEILEGRKYGEN